VEGNGKMKEDDEEYAYLYERFRKADECCHDILGIMMHSDYCIHGGSKIDPKEIMESLDEWSK